MSNDWIGIALITALLCIQSAWMVYRALRGKGPVS
jgi:hypothetical protein